MIFSIIVYTITAGLLFFLGWHYNSRVSKSELQASTIEFLSSWEMLLSFAVFTLVAALRYHTGWDHEYYLMDYEGYQNSGTILRSDFEFGFRFIESLFADLGFHYSVFFGFLGFINIFFLYFAIRKQLSVIPWVGLCLVLGPYFIHLMNTMRQGMVESFFVSFSVLIIYRKFLPYLIIAILCASFHKVAFLIIPIYLLGIVTIKIKRRYLFLIYLGFFILGQFPCIIAYAIDLFSDVIRLYGYGKYVDLMHNNANFAFMRNPFGLMSLLILVLHIALIDLYPKLKKHFAGDKFFVLSFRFALIYMCYFALTINTARYIKRPSELLFLFLLIVTGYALSYLYSTRRFKALVCMLLISCSSVYISLAKDYYKYNGEPTSIYYRFIPSLNFNKKC